MAERDKNLKIKLLYEKRKFSYAPFRNFAIFFIIVFIILCPSNTSKVELYNCGKERYHVFIKH